MRGWKQAVSYQVHRNTRVIPNMATLQAKALQAWFVGLHAHVPAVALPPGARLLRDDEED